MAYVIRPFATRDAPELSTITLAAIAVVGARDYSAEQVAAWAARHPGPERFLARAEAGAHIVVAADAEDVPVAYAQLEFVEGEGAHLDMLYCHPEHTKRGLAEELLASAEQEAVREGAARLYTEASELARPAFERAGYRVQHRRDFTIEHEGRDVPIHNYAMEKLLS